MPINISLTLVQIHNIKAKKCNNRIIEPCLLIRLKSKQKYRTKQSFLLIFYYSCLPSIEKWRMLNSTYTGHYLLYNPLFSCSYFIPYMLSHYIVWIKAITAGRVYRKKSCLFNIPRAGHYRSHFTWKIKN